MKEFPKMMHHPDKGSQVFDSQEDVDKNGQGFKEDRADAFGDEKHDLQAKLDNMRSTGLSDDQKVADAELRMAEMKKQIADANLPPGNARPGAKREDVEERPVGHNGVEFSTMSGAREAMATAETLTLDQLQRQARAMGIEFDDRATIKSLQNKIKAKVGDPDVSRFATSNPPNDTDVI